MSCRHVRQSDRMKAGGNYLMRGNWRSLKILSISNFGKIQKGEFGLGVDQDCT
jgi:hypothetical protein